VAVVAQAQQDAEAVKWLALAAEKGHAHAQCSLGVLLAEGRAERPSAGAGAAASVRAHGIGADAGDGGGGGGGGGSGGGAASAASEARAAYWFRRAADQGHVEAMCHLAAAHAERRTGVRVTVRAAAPAAGTNGGARGDGDSLVCSASEGSGSDAGADPAADVEAARWFTAAAEAGDATAQYNLATFWERGRGVARADLAEAARWYLKATCSIVFIVLCDFGVLCFSVGSKIMHRSSLSVGTKHRHPL